METDTEKKEGLHQFFYIYIIGKYHCDKIITITIDFPKTEVIRKMYHKLKKGHFDN